MKRSTSDSSAPRKKLCPHDDRASANDCCTGLEDHARICYWSRSGATGCDAARRNQLGGAMGVAFSRGNSTRFSRCPFGLVYHYRLRLARARRRQASRHAEPQEPWRLCLAGSGWRICRSRSRHERRLRLVWNCDRNGRCRRRHARRSCRSREARHRVRSGSARRLAGGRGCHRCELSDSEPHSLITLDVLHGLTPRRSPRSFAGAAPPRTASPATP
jgi:hypothetical protein